MTLIVWYENPFSESNEWPPTKLTAVDVTLAVCPKCK